MDGSQTAPPCLAKNAFGHRCMVSFSRNHLPPFTPCLRAGNMGTVQTDGLTHCPAGADLFDLLSPTGIPGGHCRRSFCRSFVHSSSISPEPFAPPAFPSTAGQDGAMDGPPGTWAPRPRDRRPMAPVGSRTRSDGLSVYGVRPPDPLGTCCQSATRSSGGFGSGMVSAVGCTRQVTGSSSASNATGSATWTGLTPVAGSW